MGYKITQHNGMLLTTSSEEYGEQVWSLCRLRRHKESKCVICGKTLGEFGFRPITNGYNRIHRICVRHEGKS